jgi:hypothetical protein
VIITAVDCEHSGNGYETCLYGKQAKKLTVSGRKIDKNQSGR